MDLSIVYNPGIFGLDLALAGADLATESGLRSAVVVSLFTDRRANADDEIPDGSNDRRGWWADSYAEIEGDLIGSRLWLLQREKQTANVLQRAREYSEEALQWLLDDKVATAVSVAAEWVDTGVLGLRVKITLPSGTPFEDVFNYPLEGR